MAEPQVLLTGIALGESPRWHMGRLWFSDWIAHTISAVDRYGQSEVIVNVPDFPFCFDWLPDGRLLVVSGSNKLLLVQEADGSLAPYADLSSLAKGWNEIVVDGRGNAYVNGSDFEFMGGGPFIPGVIALVTPDGAVRQVAEGIAFPNGMAVTPDNSTLIIAESYAHCLTAFDIAEDGGLSNRRVWATVDNSAPDGICLDTDGAVWYADVPNQHCVRVREGGEVLETVAVDRGCFACMLGGVDKRTLFIVAATWGGREGIGRGQPTGQLLTVTAPAPHDGWP